MKHFGNAYGTLKVKKNGDDGSIYITVDSQGSFAGVGIENAPALALAILEAAGITDKGFNESSDAEMAAAHLASHVGLERANAKEAADREALEAEALELFAAYHPATTFTSFSEVGEGAAHDFLNIARKAREIHKAVS